MSIWKNIKGLFEDPNTCNCKNCKDKRDGKYVGYMPCYKSVPDNTNPPGKK